MANSTTSLKVCATLTRAPFGGTAVRSCGTGEYDKSNGTHIYINGTACNTMATDAEGYPPRTFELQGETELRFEIPAECKDATLTMTRGSAEMFGVELAHNRAYSLMGGTSRAAFSWHGATLTLQAPSAALAYVAADTPMPSYLMAHAALQERRTRAERSGAPGPRALVVGPRDSGKSALVATLAAYCVKANGAAVVGDLDPSGMGAVSQLPESLSLAVVQHLDLEDGGLVVERSVSFMLGHTSPRGNMPVSRAVFGAMEETLKRLFGIAENRPHVGAIFDSCGDIEQENGPESVVAAAKAFSVDVVFVLGAERISARVRQLIESSENSKTEVVLLNKSGGVVSRDANTRAQYVSRQIRAYFYGSDNKLLPFRINVDTSTISVLKVGGQVMVVPESMLAIGERSTLDPLKVAPVKWSKDLLHSVLAVSQAENEEDVLKMPVYGYVHVLQVDVEKNLATVLTPSTGSIPGKYLLLGNTKWIE